MNREEILEFEQEMREGRYVFLERPLGSEPRYQVRIERPWKDYKWDYSDREKAWAHFESLRAAEKEKSGSLKVVTREEKSGEKRGMSERKESYLKYGYAHGGFPPPEKKWSSRLHPDE
jgi:hypothetical protein